MVDLKLRMATFSATLSSSRGGSTLGNNSFPGSSRFPSLGSGRHKFSQVFGRLPALSPCGQDPFAASVL